MVQIHPPQPNYPSTYGRSTESALSISTRTSTNRSEAVPNGLQFWLRECHINQSLSGPLRFLPWLVRPKNRDSLVFQAMHRRGLLVEDCRRTVVKTNQTEISSPLFTEKQAALYLLRSVSSLRRDRRKATGPRFVRIGRSVRYPRCELDAYITALVNTRTRGVPNA